VQSNQREPGSRHFDLLPDRDAVEPQRYAEVGQSPAYSGDVETLRLRASTLEAEGIELLEYLRRHTRPKRRWRAPQPPLAATSGLLAHLLAKK
jgi:hypothetical protein